MLTFILYSSTYPYLMLRLKYTIYHEPTLISYSCPAQSSWHSSLDSHPKSMQNVSAKRGDLIFGSQDPQVEKINLNFIQIIREAWHLILRLGKTADTQGLKHVETKHTAKKLFGRSPTCCLCWLADVTILWFYTSVMICVPANWPKTDVKQILSHVKVSSSKCLNHVP